jgi:phospholipid/cholesterol/gamma-HCH transport system substrate-binding protein
MMVRYGRRRTRRRDKPPALQTLVLGTAVVIALLAGGYELLRLYNGIPLVAYKTAYVDVPNVGNLLAHDAIRIGGVRVGQVLAVDIGADGRPRVELQLDPGTRLPTDTRVAIRANGLLGARYVSLTPGHARTLLADGGTLAGGADSYTYGLPETVAAFDRQARGGLHTMIGALGEGLAGNGATLNAALQNLGTAPGQFDAVARAVLSHTGAAARLVPALDAAMSQFAAVRSYALPFMRYAGDALQPFVSERAATRATIVALPGTLSAAQNGLTRGLHLLSSLRDLSSAAARTLPLAPSGLMQLAGLLREGQTPLRNLDPTVRTLLPPAATSATRALFATVPVLPRVKSGVDTARPILAYIGRYACDVINTGAVLRSMTGFAQPGSGPLGPAMAFRLQAVAAPAGLQVVGIKDPIQILTRSAYEPPCRYLSRPYPQLIPNLSPTGAR